MGRKKWWFLVFLFGIFWIFESAETIKWISLRNSKINWNTTSSSTNINLARGVETGKKTPCTKARRRYGLVKLQAKLCRSSTEVMPYIQNAATLAVETCQKVFKERRWNCSSLNLVPYLTPDLTRATREQAYVYAVSSAALTFSLARACASGNLHHCTCAEKPNEVPKSSFQWGGCGDNVKWAMKFSKKFIDNIEKEVMKRPEIKKRHGEEALGILKVSKNVVAALNLHNNRVGRRMISSGLYTQCKCHGVSGSCNVKTCWKSVPNLHEVGQKLLQKYTNAKEIKDGANWDNKKSSTKVSTDQLVYISKSPDYCTKDEKLGSIGTVGRHCNVTSPGPDSCRQLCCGRGYKTVVEEKIERCRCKFHNCCYVKCSICKIRTQIFECQ